MIQSKKPVYVSTCISFLFLSAIVLNSAFGQHLGEYIVSFCPDRSHYNQGSEFQKNLNLLYTNLTTRDPTTYFYNLTTGDEPNKVYGFFFCDGFGANEYCHKCVRKAVGEVHERCAFSKEYIVWYMGCMLRYSSHPIFSINEVSIYFQFVKPPVIYNEFDRILSDTFTSIIHNVTTTNSSTALAPKVVDIEGDLSLTGYGDCTPYLGKADCMNCLQTARGRFPMIGAKVGILLQPCCKLAYIFNDTRSLKPEKERPVALGITIAIAGASVILNAILLFLMRRKPFVQPTGLDEVESNESLQFEFEAIKSATDNFSPAYKLGRGGFGVVYMGTLPDGQAVAVKRLSFASGQGIREFKTEASLAAKLQHKNLVKVYGFCLEGNEKLLVYEFVPNKSLDRFLFNAERGALLRWETRYKIIVGIARGLLYLHDDSRPKIIHRDLKPSNILLDGEMNPKIADFGMARLFGGEQSQGNTSRVAGTFGYMAPEYVVTGNFSVKSDLFSYGVILLELVSGRKNSSFDLDEDDHGNLLHYAWRLWNDGNHQMLVDSALGTDISEQEVERCIHVGLLCTQEDPTNRPSIASVILMLNTEPISLSRPTSPPAFPYKHENPAVPHNSYGTVAQDVISDLSPR